MSSSLIIQEQSGNASIDRSIELRGAGLPLQGANWSAEMNMVTQFNAGNAEGTQHVLGPQELPSNWEGMWNTTRMIVFPSLYSDPNNGVSNQPIVKADTLMAYLEDIYRTGYLLKVIWAGEAGRRIVRIGRARSWDFKATRFDDIKWSTQFDWISRGQESQLNATQFLGDAILSSIREANLAATNTAAEAFGYQIAKRNLDILKNSQRSLFTLSQLSSFLATPVQVLDNIGAQAERYERRLLDLGSSIRDFQSSVASIPSAVMERATDIGNGMVETTNKFEQTLTKQPPEVISGRSRVATMLRCQNYMNNVYLANSKMGAKGDILARASRRQLSAISPVVLSRAGTHQALSQDVLRVYVPSSKDTMVTISLRFYSTDAHAAALARINGLPGYTVKPPRIPLIIPILAAIQRQSVNNV